jgi:predicted DNA-binding transcriptional regulator YafY
MRRADRLFQIVHLLRTRRGLTAAALAEELGVAQRTIYRDVADLQDSGVPIEGEAGVGYRLARGYELPPLQFDADELAALAAGARLVQAVADPELGEAARRALVKIEAAVPAGLRETLWRTPMLAPYGFRNEAGEELGVVRRAVEERRKLRFRYQRGDGAGSERIVRPVGLFYWTGRWSLAAWCELRADWRNFRVDRMAGLEPLPDTFDDTITLDAFLDALERRESITLQGTRPWRPAG